MEKDQGAKDQSSCLRFPPWFQFICKPLRRRFANRWSVELGLARSARSRLGGQRQFRVASPTTRFGGGNEKLDELSRDYPRFHDPRFARVRGSCGY